ncbi:hypothetical protein ACK8GG_14820 [Micromonosporaceae bacterium DT55]|uniref:hypothetical protein n=1 Tax=Melissospora conviva TaxID=3388432 RepID=UPI003C1332F2
MPNPPPPEPEPAQIPLTGRLWRCLAALLMALAWGVLGYGLFAAPDADGWGDMEGGGRFGVAFLVYLPYVGLSLLLACLLVPVVLLPLRNRDSSTAALILLAAAAVEIALFVFWVAVSFSGVFFLAQPLLPEALMWCLVLDAAAVGALTGGWLDLRMAQRPAPAPALAD